MGDQCCQRKPRTPNCHLAGRKDPALHPPSPAPSMGRVTPNLATSPAGPHTGSHRPGEDSNLNTHSPTTLPKPPEGRPPILCPALHGQRAPVTTECTPDPSHELSWRGPKCPREEATVPESPRPGSGHTYVGRKAPRAAWGPCHHMHLTSLPLCLGASHMSPLDTLGSPQTFHRARLEREALPPLNYSVLSQPPGNYSSCNWE